MRASKCIRWFVRGALCVSATAGARADELDQAMPGHSILILETNGGSR